MGIKIPRNELWGIPATILLATITATGLYWVCINVLNQPPFFAWFVTGGAWLATMVGLMIGCLKRYGGKPIPQLKPRDRRRLYGLLAGVGFLGLIGMLLLFVGVRLSALWFFVGIISLGLLTIVFLIRIRQFI